MQMEQKRVVRVRWFARLVAIVFLSGLVIMAACAQALPESDDGSSATSEGAGGDGGAGGATGGGETGGLGGAGGEAPVCEKEPCKLTIPQCGCGDGERCHFAGGGISCVAEGSTLDGTVCNDDCQEGFLCFGLNSGSPRICRRYCDTDADCYMPGGKCAFQLASGGAMSRQQVSVCSTNCDPITNVGCLEPNMKCEINAVDKNTYCNLAGTGIQGTSCVVVSHCAVGLSCFGTENGKKCLKWCDVGAPVCPGGIQCVPLTGPGGQLDTLKIGSKQYGACLGM